MELRPFDPAAAPIVSSWAESPEEVRRWCSHTEAPVPPEVITSWSEPADVQAYGLVDGGELVGYGELWVDDEEVEVELARLLVAPACRGRGLGRAFVQALTERARTHHPTVCLRVVPENEAARRCYTAAGFERVTAEEEAAWNVGQPETYVWMRAG